MSKELNIIGIEFILSAPDLSKIQIKTHNELQQTLRRLKLI